MTSEMTLAEAHGEDPLRLNFQNSADGFEAWNNNLNEIARHNHGERKRKKRYDTGCARMRNEIGQSDRCFQGKLCLRGYHLRRASFPLA
jgi:hypothetical protein